MSERGSTARNRVRRVQRTLLAAGAIAAVAWAATAAIATLVAWYAVRSFTDANVGDGVVVTTSLLAAIAAMLVSARRIFAASSRERAALWIEEQKPDLRFALVTAIEPAYEGVPHLERAAEFDPSAVLRRPVSRMLLPPVGALAVVVLLALALSTRRDDLAEGRIVRGLVEGPASEANPLERIRAVVTPPAYARSPQRRLSDPSTISALRGSTVLLTGRGSGVAASLGGRRLPVAGSWSTRLVMPERSTALTLERGTERRVIVLESVRDPAPVVRLQRPERDTTVRSASGSITVRALVEDDHGIAEALIEYLISSGAEETFIARAGTLRAVRSVGRRAELEATLPLAPLRLGPGDLVSIRATARDANTVSGPGVGASETRTYRVARRDEFDSLAIEAGAPIVAESSLVSQRMLILRTEAVVREQPALVADTFSVRVRAIAFDQERLRERVHDIIYPGHTHPDGALLPEGEPEDQAESSGPINPDLKRAYDEMWSASRELRIEQPSASLPFMRAAAAALDRARLANRLYLRSGTPRVIVDVPRVRLQGKERGISPVRSPAEPQLAERARIASRFSAAVAKSKTDRIAAANDLALLRGSVLDVVPRFGAALQPVIDALRRNRAADSEILLAREELEQRRVTPTLSGWSRW